ncbi:hypothetical protein Csa_005036 [Cucumis sativus]|uniref:Uncharacterized protein n=1 Tax=Cucumis sativus TaxID=3659 RepID=A0A0A0KAB8_CUCSA|nr:hypothetical protein Csa_005036 [Cucumis sativus]
MQEVDRLKVVAEELGKEIERMSPLEPRLKPKDSGLVDPAHSKKGKGKVGASRPKGA